MYIYIYIIKLQHYIKISQFNREGNSQIILSLIWLVNMEDVRSLGKAAASKHGQKSIFQIPGVPKIL